MKCVYLIEEPLYFTDFKFHKLKLAYHRASMKCYESMLIKKNIGRIINKYKTKIGGTNCLIVVTVLCFLLTNTFQ